MVGVLQLGSILCGKESGNYRGIATFGLGVHQYAVAAELCRKGCGVKRRNSLKLMLVEASR